MMIMIMMVTLRYFDGCELSWGGEQKMLDWQINKINFSLCKKNITGFFLGYAEDIFCLNIFKFRLEKMHNGKTEY